MVPIVLGCGYLRFWMYARFQTRAKKAYEKSTSYACDAISAIRTVASLTREHGVWEHYHKHLEAQASQSLTSVLRSSTLYAASQSLLLLCIGLGFGTAANWSQDASTTCLCLYWAFRLSFSALSLLVSSSRPLLIWDRRSTQRRK